MTLARSRLTFRTPSELPFRSCSKLFSLLIPRKLDVCQQLHPGKLDTLCFIILRSVGVTWFAVVCRSHFMMLGCANVGLSGRRTRSSEAATQ